jgi:putative ABC transport system substrate-binding protein
VGTTTSAVLSRRQLVRGAGAASLALLAGCGRLPWQAQSAPKIPRVGVLLTGTPGAAAAFPLLQVMRESLGELGYVEGQSVVFEARYGAGAEDRLSALAVELIQLPVDIVVAEGGRWTEAAVRATSTVPVVMVNVNAPVASGFVASLARPGGNVTGLSNLVGQLTAKRLDLLREAVPGLRELGVMWNPTNPSGDGDLRQIQEASQGLGLWLHPVEVRRPLDFEDAFRVLVAREVQALFLLGDALFFAYRTAIVDFALQHRLPTCDAPREFAEAGGLMSYGANFLAIYRRAAYYVDRILKGAKPADLPVEQPREFEFVINLKTAQALGLTIPQHVLLQATEVIQ